jgi:hypothetical protein
MTTEDQTTPPVVLSTALLGMVPGREWRSIYKERPTDGAVCVSRISGEEGYTSNTIYEAKSATFRTHDDMRNRLIITVWKHDEWHYA